MRFPTLDSLINLVSHLGDARDKQAYSAFEYRAMVEQELTAAYRGWLMNKVVNIVPEDMIREGRTVSIEGEDTGDFNDFAAELDVMGQLATGYAWGRLYGGGGNYAVIKNDNPAEPLDLERVSPSNPLVALIDFDRYDVETQLNVDPRAPNYLRPEYYRFAKNATWIHWSRIMGPFEGYRLPKREQEINLGWGGSEVERISEVALQALSANASVASVLHRANTLLMGVKGLLGKTSNPTKTEELRRRFEIAALAMSNNSFTLFDMDQEAPHNMTAQLQAPGNLMSEFLSIVAAAADIPVSRFFGTAPKGLNATGEGDRENYQAMIRGKQERVLNPVLRRLDPIIIRSVYGRDLEYTFKWNPLEQLSALEKAQSESVEADTHQKYINMGVVVPFMVAEELQAEDRYQSLDEEYVDALKHLDLEPDEPEENPDFGETENTEETEENGDRPEETEDGDSEEQEQG